jgi:hypothetical protein
MSAKCHFRLIRKAGALTLPRRSGPRESVTTKKPLGLQEEYRSSIQTEDLVRTYERPALRKSFAALLAASNVA